MKVLLWIWLVGSLALAALCGKAWADSHNPLMGHSEGFRESFLNEIAWCLASAAIAALCLVA